LYKLDDAADPHPGTWFDPAASQRERGSLLVFAKKTGLSRPRGSSTGKTHEPSLILLRADGVLDAYIAS